MDNLARKFNDPKEVVALFQDEYKSIDLLKMFLLTSANDVSKTFEMLTKWEKNSASPAEKASFLLAQETLKRVILKRIELTATMYQVEVSSPIAQVKTTVDSTKEETTAVKEEQSTSILIPLDKIMEQARLHFQESVEKLTQVPMTLTEEEIKEMNDKNKDTDNPNIIGYFGTIGEIQSEAYSKSFKLLKNTLGAGRYLLPNGKPSKKIWDIDEVNETLDKISGEFFKVDNSELEKVQQDVSEIKVIKLNDVFVLMKSSFESGKTKEEIVEEVKNLVIGVKLSDNDQIVDEAAFNLFKEGSVNAYYESLVVSKEATDKLGTKKTKEEIVEEAISELSPEIEALDKDGKESSIAVFMKKLRSIFLKNNYNLDLKSAKAEAEKIIARLAPNLWERYKAKHKISDEQTVITTDVVAEEPSVEIYDDSHNYKETNPELAEKAKTITDMKTLFETAKALSDAGNWKDALSMVIERTSSSEILVKPANAEPHPFLFDTAQAKTWFKQNILDTPNMGSKTVENIIEDKATFAQDVKTDAVETNQVKEEAGTDSVQAEEKQQGPVPAAGFTNDVVLYPSGKENAEDSEVIAYVIKLKKGSLTLMVANSELSVDYPNHKDAQAKIEEVIGMLVENGNAYKQAKEAITSFFSSYTIPAGTMKSLMQYVVDEAIATRQYNKRNKKKESKKTKETSVETVNTETTEPSEIVNTETTKVTELPTIKEEEVVTTTEETPVEETTETTPEEQEKTEEQVVEEPSVDSPTPSGDIEESKDSTESTSDPLVETPEIQQTEEKSESPKSSTTQEPAVTTDSSGVITTSDSDSIPFESIKPMLTAKDKGNLNRAIGAFYLGSSDKEVAKQQLMSIFSKYAKDKNYRKFQIYRHQGEAEYTTLIEKVIENSIAAGKV